MSLCFIIELLVLQTAEFYEGLISSIFAVAFALVIKESVKLVRNLLGNMSGNLVYIAVILQKAPRNIERQIGGSR